MADEYILKQDAVNMFNRAVQDVGILDADDIEIVFGMLSPADVAPVVRCENCIHWSDSNQCARPELSGSRWHDPKYFDTYPDDFCSYGERKE
jgi:hypothetical protein